MESNSPDILATARERARNLNLPYAGALTPAEAHRLMMEFANTKLVDVRTRAELEWVGAVPGSIAVEWNTWPGGSRNPNFVGELEKAVADKNTTILFLCRSGGRSDSAAAAAAAAGYGNAYNILEGFEGDKDANGQRNRSGGWRHAGLPWSQS